MLDPLRVTTGHWGSVLCLFLWAFFCFPLSLLDDSRCFVLKVRISILTSQLFWDLPLDSIVCIGWYCPSNGEAANNIFKALGYEYHYIADGNNVHAIIDVLQKVKDSDHAVLLHISTLKGNKRVLIIEKWWKVEASDVGLYITHNI